MNDMAITPTSVDYTVPVEEAQPQAASTADAAEFSSRMEEETDYIGDTLPPGPAESNEMSGGVSEESQPAGLTESDILTTYGQEALDGLKGLDFGVFNDGVATAAELALANERLFGATPTFLSDEQVASFGETDIAVLNSIGALTDGKVSVAEVNLAVERLNAAPAQAESLLDPESILQESQATMNVQAQQSSEGVTVDAVAAAGYAATVNADGTTTYTSPIGDAGQHNEQRSYTFNDAGALQSVNYEATDKQGNALISIENVFDTDSGLRTSSTLTNHINGATITYQESDNDASTFEAHTLSYYDKDSESFVTLTAPPGEPLLTSTGLNEEATPSAPSEPTSTDLGHGGAGAVQNDHRVRLGDEVVDGHVRGGAAGLPRRG